jgi:putative ABC transport system permease protein
MTGWRTALRIAWREARRARSRAALVVAMILLPVAALSFVAVNYDIFELTPQERAERLMGTAQAVVSWPYDGPVEQEPEFTAAFPTGAPGAPTEPTLGRLLALLPPGTTAIPDQSGSLTVHTATGTGTVDARALDYADPLAEVALTPAASARLGAGVGGSVRLAAGDRTLRIVGIVENPDNLEATTIVLRPGALPAAVLPVDRADLSWLVATPGSLTWAEVKRLNTHGLVAVSRHVMANPPDPAERYTQRMSRSGPPAGTFVLVGGMAMLEIVLLAGAV